jgi:hypothetical protein
MVAAMNRRAPLAAGAVVAGLALMGCGSKAAPTAISTSSSVTTAAPSSSTTTPAVTTTVAVTTGAPVCPTHGQADAALGAAYAGPISTSTRGGGIVCEYTGGPGGTNAGVTVFAHQSAAVFAGQVAHAPGAPAMPGISGVGDGAFGSDIGGRSIVNAYSNGSRTLVAAQASSALGPVEALARVALADN